MALVRPRVRALISGRENLVLGTYEPDDTNTGVLPGISRTLVNGDLTTTSNGQVITDKNIAGRLLIQHTDVVVNNCFVYGQAAGPSANPQALIDCQNSAVRNAVITDCTVKPQTPDYRWNCVMGHDFTLNRVNGSLGGDIVQINLVPVHPRTTTLVNIYGCYLHEPTWWTAASAGTVHPSDTENHADIIQHFGGGGTQVIGNSLVARFARQAGHWYATQLTAEPYSLVALHSLGDSLNGPNNANWTDRNLRTGSSTTNGQPNTEANGRYNYANLSVMLIDNDTGDVSKDLVITDNYMYGGFYAINGGGNIYPGGAISLGEFKRNKFSRDQASQGSGGDTTQTINFQGTGWTSSLADIPTTGANANTYKDNGNYITVRY